MNYPERDRFFAHRFVRLLHKAAVAAEIGRDAFALLTVVAHTEDAMRYRGAAKFWNSQLVETLGFKKWDQFDACRKRAIETGWLVYRCHGKRMAGEYWVTVPEGYEMVSDCPIESYPENGYDRGYKDGYKDGYEQGMNEGTNRVRTGVRTRDEQGEPSNPIPNPIPNKKNKHQDSPEFEQFWNVYPRKTAKGNARKAWATATKKADPEAIVAAAGRYAKLATDPKFTAHPATWLNAERWLDEDMQPTKKPRLPDFDTPEGMAELQRQFAEGLHA